MAAPSPIHSDPPARPDMIQQVADYLHQYPEEIVDAKQLLRRFRVSAREFYQALLQRGAEVRALTRKQPEPVKLSDAVEITAVFI